MAMVLLIALFLFAAYLLFVLCFGIFKTYTSQRVPVYLDLKDLSTGAPPDAWGGSGRTDADALLALGFQHTGFLGTANSNSAFVELFTHPLQPVSAQVSLLIKGMIRHSYVQLKTSFDDQSILCTLNSTQPGIFTYPPEIEIRRPGPGPLDAMLRGHLEAVAASSVNRAPLPAPQTEDLNTVIDSNARVTLFQVDCGLLRPTGQATVLRYTFPGAVRATFKIWSRFQFLRPQRA